MSDQTNAVQGGIETTNHIVFFFLILSLNIFFIIIIFEIIAVFNLCIFINILSFPPNMYKEIDKIVQSGSGVTGYRRS